MLPGCYWRKRAVSCCNVEQHWLQRTKPSETSPAHWLLPIPRLRTSTPSRPGQLRFGECYCLAATPWLAPRKRNGRPEEETLSPRSCCQSGRGPSSGVASTTIPGVSEILPGGSTTRERLPDREHQALTGHRSGRATPTDGSGWVSAWRACWALTQKHSSRRVCGWRQLRSLLRQGQGVFWDREKSVIWLRSTLKDAATLCVSRLSGRPVELPVAVLCGEVGEIRAHFYASFHSGRRTLDGEAQTAAPVARVTLAEVISVPLRTQQLPLRTINPPEGE